MQQPALRSLSAAPPARRVRPRASPARARATDSPRNEEEAVLDAFLLGRALAETLNARAGAAIGAAVAQVSSGALAPEAVLKRLAEAAAAPNAVEAALGSVARADAELRQELLLVAEEVAAKARAERQQAAPTEPLEPPAPADAAATLTVQAAAAALGAEVAAAMAEVQRFQAHAAPVPAAAPFAAAAAAPPVKLGGAADAEAWIEAWRSRTGHATPSPPQSAEAWIARWRENGK